MNNELKETALYIRVSTETQAEEGYSIPAQQERLEGYCQAMGWKNTKLYIDGGFSGSNLMRPKIKELIKDVQESKIKTVVVYKLDRLSRSQKDTLYLIEDIFIPNNVDFVSLNESIDTSTPYGRAMIGILSAFAQLERENIFMRTRMGMLERVKEGFWPGGGMVPFGYDYNKETGILIPNKDADTVRKIYELYIKGYSAMKIAEMLDLKYDRLVMQILERKSNIGMIPYKGELYQGRHEPIIDVETFELAQRQIKLRGEKARATIKSDHLLTGLIYCGECGARMRYIKNGQNNYKLMCYSKDKSKKHMHKTANCNSEYVSAELVENIVLEDLFNISVDISQCEEKAEQIDPVEEMEKQIVQMESKIKNLYNLLAETNDKILLETIEENKTKLNRLKADYEEEKKSNQSKKYIEYVKDEVTNIRDIWNFLNNREKQMIIRDCIDKIIIGEQQIEVFYAFKKSKSKIKAA